MGINYPANRPDPDDPGGLGAEESGAERTGPTQYLLVATQRGGRWAEVGPYYDFANDPVTGYFQRVARISSVICGCYHEPASGRTLMRQR